VFVCKDAAYCLSQLDRLPLGGLTRLIVAKEETLENSVGGLVPETCDAAADKETHAESEYYHAHGVVILHGLVFEPGRKQLIAHHAVSKGYQQACD